MGYSSPDVTPPFPEVMEDQALIGLTSFGSRSPEEKCAHKKDKKEYAYARVFP